ncbi:MAG: hypothetical protein JO303_06285 [Caulobacteraceae bacterium]|nr:hypothetical protein [Caulobacteraceae bacterium]
MNENYTRLKLIFLGLFVLTVVGLWGYNALYVWPARTCESHGDWWDERDRACGVPAPLTVWTKRPAGEPAKDAAERPAARS